VQKQALENIPICQIVSAGPIKEIQDLLSRVHVRHGSILADYSKIFKSYIPAKCVSLDVKGEVQFVSASRSEWFTGKTILYSHKNLENSEKQPIRLRSKGGIGGNSISFNKFCADVNKLYQEYAGRKEREMPELHFIFQKSRFASCEWSVGSYGCL